MGSNNVRKRFAKRGAGLQRKARAVGVSLSRLLHRDAEMIRRRAMKAERRAYIAVSSSWHRLKPKVVEVEHRMHDGMLAFLHRLRPIR